MQMVRLVLLAAAAGLTACTASPLRVTTGAVSSFVCLGTFGSGEAPDQVYADTFRPIPAMGLLDWALRYEVDREHREVRTTLVGGFTARAAFREDVGCRMLPGGGALEAPGAPATPGPALLQAIAGPEVVVPRDPRLVAALDHAFVEPADGPPRRTKAVVVVHRGQVIAERYAPGYGIDTPILGNSVTKSVMNALLGILVREGRLTVTGPAPVVAWQQDARRDITIDDLLRMRSGLDLGDSLMADLTSLWARSNRALFVESDTAGYSIAAPLEHLPASHWTYADGSTAILSRVLRDAMGGNAEAVRAFAWRELFGPLGMTKVIPGFDSTGTPVGANQMLAPARDWARLGLLYLNDGVIGGRRILPEGWVAYSAAPTPGAWIGYGAGFWTNRDASFGARRRVAWGMPADAFFGRGMFGQFVVVIPSADLVIARFGTSHGEQEIDGICRLIVEVTAALQLGG